jgi:hypothetical protein
VQAKNFSCNAQEIGFYPFAAGEYAGIELSACPDGRLPQPYIQFTRSARFFDHRWRRATLFEWLSLPIFKNPEVYFESEVFRLKGEALLAQDYNIHSQAAAESFRKSYDIANQLKARALQLRTALALYAHRDVLGVSESQARILLEETYSSIPAENSDSEVCKAREILGALIV